jgi:serine/threonine protein kinase
VSEINIEEIRASIEKSGWHLGREIGSGGGAKIFLCLKSPLVDSLNYFMKQCGTVVKEVSPTSVCLKMLDSLYHSFLPGSSNVAAVKVPKILDEPSERERLKREIEALQAIKHPSLIRLYEADIREPSRWFIMEYHPKGSLQNQVDLYAGKPLETIKAVQGLAECLSLLHSHPSCYVHRDIKPKNIFVDFYGRLVLGDFGIVFPNEDDGDRLTIPGTSEIFSRDWVPDWVRFRQLEKNGPKMDVYMLAKVIYYMVSGGKNVFASQLGEADFDLTKQFPNSADIVRLYRFLNRCITTKESECEFNDGKEFLAALNDLVQEMVYRPPPQLIFSLFQPHSVTYIPIQRTEDMSLREIILTQVFLGKGLSHFRACVKVVSEVERNAVNLGFKLGPYPSNTERIAGASFGSGEWSHEMDLDLDKPVPNDQWCTLRVEARADLSGASLLGINIYGQ